jgi:hypothetical protein
MKHGFLLLISALSISRRAATTPAAALEFPDLPELLSRRLVFGWQALLL